MKLNGKHLSMEPEHPNNDGHHEPEQNRCAFLQDVSIIIQSMREQEQTYPLCKDYMTAKILTSADSSGTNAVDKMWRIKMYDWCIRTVEFFDLSRNCAHMSMSCLDRFLSGIQEDRTHYLTNKRMYQLACVVCLYISIKVHEPVVLGVSMIVELCQGIYTREQIHETECEVLETLQWRLNQPTVQSYMDHFMLLLDNTSMILSHTWHKKLDRSCQTKRQKIRREFIHLCTYICEVAMADYKLSVMMCSSASKFEIAVACFTIASSTISETDVITTAREISTNIVSLFGRKKNAHVGCLFETVMPIVTSLTQLSSGIVITTIPDVAASSVSYPNFYGTANPSKTNFDSSFEQGNHIKDENTTKAAQRRTSSLPKDEAKVGCSINTTSTCGRYESETASMVPSNNDLTCGTNKRSSGESPVTVTATDEKMNK